MSDSLYEGNAKPEPAPAKPDPEATLRPLLERVELAAAQRGNAADSPPHIWAFAAGLEAGALRASLLAALELLEVEW